MKSRNNKENSNQNKKAELSAKYFAHLHQGAKPVTHQYARELRQTPTEAEKKLWSLLRNRQLRGKKFRRQHPIANYILDFYCHECKLGIELDGNVHSTNEAKKYDRSRTALLKVTGITILRFWNGEILNYTSTVLQKILAHMD